MATSLHVLTHEWWIMGLINPVTFMNDKRGISTWEVLPSSGIRTFFPLHFTEATALGHTVRCTHFLSFSCIMHSWNVDFKSQCRMFDPQALPQDLLSTHHLTMFRLTPGHLQVTSVLQPSQPQGLEGSIPLPHSPFTLSTRSSWSCPALVPERKGSQLSVWKWPRHPWQPKGCGLAQHHNSSPVLSVISPPLCLHLPSGADYGGAEARSSKQAEQWLNQTCPCPNSQRLWIC